MSSSTMSKRLEGKTILITGASSGIGRSTAFEFARTSPHGLRLILTSRRLEALREVSAAIIAEVGTGVKIHIQALDMTKPDEIQQLFPSLPEEFKNIDILVNNAGIAIAGMSHVASIPSSDITTMFNTNVLGLIALTQSILPVFLSRPNGGQGDIININSIAGHEPYPGGSIYCATKAAVHSFSDALRRELIGTRIRVMEIAPGQVETEFSVVRFGGDREKAKKVYEGCEPLTPDDVAEIVVWQAGRKENVVVADVLLYPNHQAGATSIHRRL